MRVASTPSPAFRYNQALPGFGEIMKYFACFAVGHDSPDRHWNVAVFTVSAVALVALAVQTSSGAKLGVESELQESVELGGGFYPDRAASASVPSGRASARDELFTAECGDSVAAVPALY